MFETGWGPDGGLDVGVGWAVSRFPMFKTVIVSPMEGQYAELIVTQETQEY